MSEKPLTPWIISEPNGKILAAHCDCMAGLGETSSHVASLRWAIAAGIEWRQSLTVTQKSAYWVMIWYCPDCHKLEKCIKKGKTCKV